MEIYYTNAYNTKYREVSRRMLEVLSGRVLDEDTPAAAGRYGGTPVHMLQTEDLHQSVLWMSRALSWFSAGKMGTSICHPMSKS